MDSEGLREEFALGTTRLGKMAKKVHLLKSHGNLLSHKDLPLTVSVQVLLPSETFSSKVYQK